MIGNFVWFYVFLTFMSKTNKTNSGFGMLEAIIALTVFIIGILGVLQVLPNAARLALQARQKTQAAFLNQAKMEEYLARSYSELEAGVAEPRAPIIADTSSQLAQFETEVVLSYIDADLNEVVDDQGLMKITITTYWPEGAREKEEQLVTFVARY